MADEKQGDVGEPDELAAEDVVGGQETPSPRQQDREQAIADEPVAESEQRAPEATEPTTAGAPSGGPGGRLPGASETVYCRAANARNPLSGRSGAGEPVDPARVRGRIQALPPGSASARARQLTP